MAAMLASFRAARDATQEQIDFEPITQTVEECAKEFAAWSAIVGGHTIGEGRAAAPVRLDSAQWRGPDVTRAALEELTASAERAGSLSLAASHAEELARVKMQTLPEWDMAKAAQRARDAEGNHNRLLEQLAELGKSSVPGFRPRPREPSLRLASGPADTVERSGERPSPAEEADAGRIQEGRPMGELRREHEALTSQALRWSEEEHKRLREAATTLGGTAPPKASRTAVEAKTLLDQAEAELAAARQVLAALVPTCAAAAAKHSQATERDRPHGTIASLEAAASAAKEWHAAAQHVDTLRSRHQPRPGCEGCAHMTALLAGGATAEAAARLAAAELALEMARAVDINIAKAKCRGVPTRKRNAAREEHAAILAAAEQDAALITARARLAEMNEARVAAHRRTLLGSAIGIRERAAYWASRDASAWSEYDAALASWTTEEAAARAQLKAELTQSLSAAAQSRDQARDLAAKAQEGEGRRAGATEALTAAIAAHTAARAVEAEARKACEERKQKRREALGACLWWGQAELKATRQTAARAAAEAFEEAARASEVAHQAAAKAKAALSEFTQARAVLERKAASHRREADRLAIELRVEADRAAKHSAAAAKQATLKAYRAVLRPTGGSATGCSSGRGRCWTAA